MTCHGHPPSGMQQYLSCSMNLYKQAVLEGVYLRVRNGRLRRILLKICQEHPPPSLPLPPSF